LLEQREHASAGKTIVIKIAKVAGAHGANAAKNAILEFSPPSLKFNRIKLVMAKIVKQLMEREGPNSAMSNNAQKILMVQLVVMKLQLNAWLVKEVFRNRNSASISLIPKGAIKLRRNPIQKNAAKQSPQAALPVALASR
jgi:hypothetical protein